MNFPGYRIEKRIGSGGMANVYLAIQESLDRRVALKVLNATLADDEQYSQRFLNEGRIIAALNHRNIITIHDVGVADGHHYIAMEYVDGGDLRARMAQPMQPEAALDLVRTLAGALDFAHRAGLVHRDVKPANILFRHDGTPLLTDFGIAKRRESDLTLGGTVLGTPGYLSPEQAKGEEVDGRSDLYSLGVMLYEMLVGRRPFEADTEIATILAQLQEPIPELPLRLARLQPLLDRMIARDPAERFRDVPTMLVAMDAQEGSDPAPRHLDRRIVAGALAVAGVVLTLAALWLVGAARQESVSTPVRDAARATSDPGPASPPAVLTPASGPLSASAMAEELVALGRAALERGHLVTPPGENALEKFRETLALDPDNGPAKEGLTEIASRFVHKARKSLDSRQFAAADEQVRHAQAARPDDPRLAELSRQVRDALAQIENQLALAEKSLEDSRLTTPPDHNALHYYESVLELQPGNPRATEGKARIARRYAQLARSRIANYRYDDARELIRRGLQVQPGNPQLLALRDKASIKSAPGQLVKDIKGLFD